MLKITPKITIAGAGSIGCFVGGLLVAAGHDVTFLGRKRIGLQLEQHGLILTDCSGMDVSVEPDAIRFSEDPNVLADADIIAVCVKSSATEEIARLVREHARNDVVIISLQNGLRNADILKEALSEFDVRAGMVPFNVVQAEESRFHRGTSGDIVIEAGAPDISAILKTENLPFHASDDIKSVQWGKLLFNLNNGLNALSDLPLVEQLSDATLRRQFADVMSEALGVMKAAGIHPTPPQLFLLNCCRISFDCQPRFFASSPNKCWRWTRKPVRPCGKTCNRVAKPRLMTFRVRLSRWVKNMASPHQTMPKSCGKFEAVRPAHEANRLFRSPRGWKNDTRQITRRRHACNLPSHRHN